MPRLRFTGARTYPPARGHREIEGFLLAWLLASGLGCSGEVGPNNPGPPIGMGGSGSAAFAGTTAPGVTAGVGGAGTAGSSAMPPDPGPGACMPKLPQRVVLLNELQHANAVTSTLGDTARDPDLQVSADTKAFAQKGLVVSTSLVHDRMNQAEFAATSLSTRFTEVTGCPTAGDAACARGFLERFAEKAFRRPVASAEIDDVMKVFEIGMQTDFQTGVKLAVHALLAAPSFTYRTEIGQVDASRRRSTPDGFRARERAGVHADRRATRRGALRGREVRRAVVVRRAEEAGRAHGGAARGAGELEEDADGRLAGRQHLRHREGPGHVPAVQRGAAVEHVPRDRRVPAGRALDAQCAGDRAPHLPRELRRHRAGIHLRRPGRWRRYPGAAQAGDLAGRARGHLDPGQSAHAPVAHGQHVGRGARPLRARRPALPAQDTGPARKSGGRSRRCSRPT